MAVTSPDTIAALATPPGIGGIGVVRVSGPAACSLAERILGHCPEPRRASYLPFHDDQGQVIDQGIAIYFPAPHSFTGEEVLELQGHGGMMVMDMLLASLFRMGARPAEPGEFSRRAFLNDKMDLLQAEAVMDLIGSASEQAARSALRSLQGAFSSLIEALVEQLVRLRIHVEAAIDFPEEEIDFLADGHIQGDLEVIVADLAAIRSEAKQGAILREGMTIVLAGLPNAGKSSLLNALSGRESAIVTEIPGTTRDVLREQVAIDGMPLHVIDTAGLRESGDRVEQEGVKRAWREIERADRLLLVVDDRLGFGPAQEAVIARLPERLPLTIVHNKVDLTGRKVGLEETERGVELALAANAGVGIELLKGHLKRVMGYQAGGEGTLMARRRHLEALAEAHHHLVEGRRQLLESRAGELLAEELREAQAVLGTITGAVSADDLLGRIFSEFCIGK